MELNRLTENKHVITGRQLHAFNFADFVARVYISNVGYPQSLQSRVFQVLRDKGYITMDRKSGGTYAIL